MRPQLEFLRFKTEVLENQFWSTDKTHPRIVGLTLSLGNWIWTKISPLKPLIITAVWRNAEEQKQLYGVTQAPDSPHFCNPLCRAVDFRAKDDYFTKPEQAEINKFITTHFKRSDGKPTIIWHSVADEFHGHIQVEKS